MDAAQQVERLVSLLHECAVAGERDPETRFPGPAAFARMLDHEVERAVRCKTSLSLVLLDAGAVEAGAEAACGAHLAEVLVNQKRKYDFAARLGTTEFALLLPGTGLTATRILAARVLGKLDQMADTNIGTCRMGIASIKGLVSLAPEKFQSLAQEALERCGDAVADRIQAAPIPDIGMTPKSTLVHSQEKRFLFTGR
jgi:GGDEF domain-containing protein